MGKGVKTETEDLLIKPSTELTGKDWGYFSDPSLPQPLIFRGGRWWVTKGEGIAENPEGENNIGNEEEQRGKPP